MCVCTKYRICIYDNWQLVGSPISMVGGLCQLFKCILKTERVLKIDDYRMTTDLWNDCYIS